MVPPPHRLSADRSRTQTDATGHIGALDSRRSDATQTGPGGAAATCHRVPRHDQFAALFTHADSGLAERQPFDPPTWGPEPRKPSPSVRSRRRDAGSLPTSEPGENALGRLTIRPAFAPNRADRRSSAAPNDSVALHGTGMARGQSPLSRVPLSGDWRGPGPGPWLGEPGVTGEALGSHPTGVVLGNARGVRVEQSSRLGHSDARTRPHEAPPRDAGGLLPFAPPRSAKAVR